MNTPKAPSGLSTCTSVASALLAAVLLLVPFHALLTVAGSLLVGNYDVLRLWKEAVLLVLLPVAAVLAWKLPAVRRQLRQGWLPWLLTAYVLLHLLLGLLALAKGQVNAFALVYAWIVNLRPLLVLVLAWIFTAAALALTGRSWLHTHWRRLLLWPAALVVGFGLLQALVLPPDFLQRLGYGPATIEPFETIDQKLDYIRVQSTLRGSNPLGAYLVVVLAACLVLLRRRPATELWPGVWRRYAGPAILAVAGGFVLLASYSRSAYLGLAVTVAASLALALHTRRARRRAGWLLAAAVVAGFGFLALFRDNDRLENILFHTDENSLSAMSSNEQRAGALQAGVRDVVTEPFGRGPGSAGPASLHNVQPARIAESYYLQIGQETGWLGLGLFVAILAALARRLWQRRADPLARALLVGLAGLSFINLVQHAWTDDTLAILWWGLAGVAIAFEVGAGANASTAAKRKA